MSRAGDWSGAITVATIVAACWILPAVMPAPPTADPVHAALLPPLTKVTELGLVDGRVITSPTASAGPSGWVVASAGRELRIESSQVVAVRESRAWLGTDHLGRDVARDLMHGGRLSIAIAAIAVLVALVIGLATGLVAATGGRTVDAAIMRLVDGLLAFPVLFLVILVAALIRPGPWILATILGVTSWMGLARLVRGQVMTLRGRGFVLAARIAGSPWHRIWRWHYLPHLVGPIGQDVALRAGGLILAEATLSYLGLGVPPDVPTWGSMVREGHRVMIDGWWLATLPGLAVAALVVALAVAADQLAERRRRLT